MNAGTFGADRDIFGAAREFRAIASDFVKAHGVAGASLGIVAAGELVWSAGLGLADRATGRPADERTVYRIASITKTFTATAIVQLRDAGGLRLDDPLVEHLPEARAIRNRFGPMSDITIRRLLDHTSGLQGEPPNRQPLAYSHYTIKELLAVLGDVIVAIAPGSAHKYSNLGYELLGEVIRRVAGRPYRDYVREAITEPLGMRSTTHEPQGALLDRLAVGYNEARYSDDLGLAQLPPPGSMAAGGGLYSSVEDLARWVAQQCRTDATLERGEQQVLAGCSLREMQRPTVVIDPAWLEAQGLGWYGTRRSDLVLIGHSGALDGFQSNVSFLPDEGLGAIVLVNGIAPATELAIWLIEAALPLHRAEQAAARTFPAPPAVPAAWAELLGRYVDPALGDGATVEWRAGRLLLVPDEGARGPHWLEPADDPLTFTIQGGRLAGEAVRFLRGTSGAVERLLAAGYPMIRMMPAGGRPARE